MRLILSSCDFGNEKSRQVILDNLPKPIEECRLLFIPNENATHEAIKSGKYHKRMANRGFSIENVYIFDSQEAEKYRGLDIDVIYISGGNTFATLQKLRDCNFDKEIIKYIKAGVTYIGGSAGAHIASASIAHVAVWDKIPSGFVNLKGLGLFDGIFICHFSPDRQECYEELKEISKHRIYTLTDDEWLLVKKVKGE